MYLLIKALLITGVLSVGSYGIYKVAFINDQGLDTKATIPNILDSGSVELTGQVDETQSKKQPEVTSPSLSQESPQTLQTTQQLADSDLSSSTIQDSSGSSSKLKTASASHNSQSVSSTVVTGEANNGTDSHKGQETIERIPEQVSSPVSQPTKATDINPTGSSDVNQSSDDQTQKKNDVGASTNETINGESGSDSGNSNS